MALRKPRPLTSSDGRSLWATPIETEHKRQLWALPLAPREVNASGRWYREDPSVELLYCGDRGDRPSIHAQTTFSERELLTLAGNPPERPDRRQIGNDRVTYTPKDARRLLAILTAHLEARQRAIETIGPRQRLSPLAG